MNYDPRWSTYPPQQMFGYPPAGPSERVVYMPAPKSKSEMKEFLKFQKIMKELEEGKKKPEEKKKEEDKKPGAMTYLQQAAVCFAISPFVVLANAFIILFIIRAFKGL